MLFAVGHGTRRHASKSCRSSAAWFACGMSMDRSPRYWAGRGCVPFILSCKLARPLRHIFNEVTDCWRGCRGGNAFAFLGMPQEFFADPHSIFLLIAHRAENLRNLPMCRSSRFGFEVASSGHQRRSSERPEAQAKRRNASKTLSGESPHLRNLLRARRRRARSGNMMATAPVFCVRSEFDGFYSRRSPRMGLECSAFCRR
jgi:hypothetical protein